MTIGLKRVLRPFLIADELIGNQDPTPRRYVIDFRGLDVLQARKFDAIFRQVEKAVFPWPQSPSLPAVKKVAAAAVTLRDTRTKLLGKHEMSLRDLYRSMELPGVHPLKEAHAKLDAAVRDAYGMTPKQDALAFLLALNGKVVAAEHSGQQVQAPGLPRVVKRARDFVSTDALQP